MGTALKQQPNEIASNFQPQDEQNLMKERGVPKKIEQAPPSQLIEGKNVEPLCQKMSQVTDIVREKCPYSDMKKLLEIDWGAVDHVFTAKGHDARNVEYFTIAIENTSSEKGRADVGKNMVTLGIGKKDTTVTSSEKGRAGVEKNMVTLGLGKYDTTLTITDKHGRVKMHALEEKGAGIIYTRDVQLA